jgi:hypothetical protein
MTNRLRRFLLALATMAGVLLVPSVVFAGAEPPAADTPPVALNSETDTDLFTLSPVLVIFVLGTVIPFLNGLITKVSTSSAVKAIVSLLLSAVAGLVTVAITPGGGAVFSEQALVAAGLAFATQLVTYLGFWKPLGVTSSVVSVTQPDGTVTAEPGKLANVGVS